MPDALFPHPAKFDADGGFSYTTTAEDGCARVGIASDIGLMHPQIHDTCGWQHVCDL